MINFNDPLQAMIFTNAPTVDDSRPETDCFNKEMSDALDRTEHTKTAAVDAQVRNIEQSDLQKAVLGDPDLYVQQRDGSIVKKTITSVPDKSMLDGIPDEFFIEFMTKGLGYERNHPFIQKTKRPVSTGGDTTEKMVRYRKRIQEIVGNFRSRLPEVDDLDDELFDRMIEHGVEYVQDCITSSR